MVRLLRAVVDVGARSQPSRLLPMRLWRPRGAVRAGRRCASRAGDVRGCFPANRRGPDVPAGPQHRRADPALLVRTARRPRPGASCRGSRRLRTATRGPRASRGRPSTPARDSLPASRPWRSELPSSRGLGTPSPGSAPSYGWSGSTACPPCSSRSTGRSSSRGWKSCGARRGARRQAGRFGPAEAASRVRDRAPAHKAGCQRPGPALPRASRDAVPWEVRPVAGQDRQC